jgi:hypothetical protein
MKDSMEIIDVPVFKWFFVESNGAMKKDRRTGRQTMSIGDEVAVTVAPSKRTTKLRSGFIRGPTLRKKKLTRGTGDKIILFLLLYYNLPCFGEEKREPF